MTGKKDQDKAAAEVAKVQLAAKNSLDRQKRLLVRSLEAIQADVLSYIEKTPSKDVVNIISSQFDSWKENLAELQVVDYKLMEFIDQSLDTSAISAEEEVVSKDYTNYFRQFRELKGKLRIIEDSLTPEIPSGSHTRQYNTSCVDTSLINPIVKLQGLPVPKFDGKFSNFPEWYAEFSSMYDKNDRFNDFERLFLLKRAMIGDAETLVKDIGNEGTLYRDIFNGLHTTYFNRRRIVAEHFCSLLSLPSIKTQNLRENVERVKRILRGLKICNIDIVAMSPFVCYLVGEKIPDKLKFEFNNSIHDNSQYPSFELLAKFLLQRSLSYETSTTSHTTDGSSKAGNSSSSQKSQPTSGKNKNSSVPEKRSFVASKPSGKPSPPTCRVCNGIHYLNKCNVFAGKSVQERFDIVKENKLCLKCFNPNHTVSSCTWRNCIHCEGNHNTLLHRDNSNNDQSSETKNQSQSSPKSSLPNSSVNPVSSNTSLSVCALSSKKSVILSTAVVRVQGRTKTELGRILIDPGSEVTLITREFCDRANLEIVKSEDPITLVGINASDKPSELNSSVRCVLRSRITNFSIAINAEVIGRIPYRMDLNKLTEIVGNFPYELGECFDLPYDRVDLLLGNEYAEFVFGEKRHFIDGLVLRESYFGYIVSGSKKSSFLAQKSSLFCGLTNASLSEQFNRFYALDNVTDNQVNEKCLEHELIDSHFENTYYMDKDTGKFVIRLPVKDSISLLHGSYAKAHAILINSERRRSEVKHQGYCGIFDEYLKRGDMTKISSVPNKKAYFIPHHLISERGPGSLSHRVVFNASFEDESGTSLNDHLLQGPTIQPNMLVNVERFRMHRYGVCADIAKMYRCILVDPADRFWQNILFRFVLSDAVKIFELNTLTNGIGPASFLAQKCVAKVGSSILIVYPIAANSILKDFFMDNWMSGAQNLADLIDLQQVVHSTLLKFGFPLCKYQSNSKEFLGTLDPLLIEPLKSQALGGEEFIYVLGLVWCPETDTLRVCIELKTLPDVITKRIMLSDISRIFDVLGMIAPVTVRGKILLQVLWKEGRQWDEPISAELASEFLAYREELPLLSSYSIPRCYCYSENIVKQQLIGFCDASTSAYCAVVYIRSIDSENNIATSFICSKTRVAPIKTVHIHRLELSSAELLAQLISQVGSDLKIEDFILFSDSQVALSWINLNPLKLKIFVSNRVSKIIKLTEKEKWFYVESASNPADLATRGISPKNLLDNSLWKFGPLWLNNAQFDSYISHSFRPIGDIPEIKVEKVNFSIVEKEPMLSFIKNKSSVYKTISVMAYILRFVSNLKRCVGNRDSSQAQPTSKVVCRVEDIEPLSIEERNTAYFQIIHFVQVEFFEKEFISLSKKVNLDKRSRLLSLHVFLDSHNVIRVGGRLQASNFSYENKYPIIVDAKSVFVERYVRMVHERYYHATKSFVLNFIRGRFWVVGNLISLIKRVIHRCVLCTRCNARVVEQLMGDLPKDRITVSRPFSSVGVDLTGAIMIKCTNHRNVKFVKVYAAFFVCCVTRAIHIEIIEDLTTEAFLNTLERFSSRRGLPRVIYSDNGTNFVGSNNVLQESKFHRFCNENSIEWKTIAPRSPHQGGLWEASVKSGKSLLLRAIGEQRLNLFELSTILAKIEAILNSRPLAYRKTDQFVSPLTPGHFLIGSSFLEVPIIDDGTVKLKQRYMLWRKIVESFWTTWKCDYLNQLQVRSKWKVRSKNLMVDDVVLIYSKNEPIFSWPIGIIVEVFPDKAGIVRNVNVRLANGNIRKTSVQNLVILPIADNEN